MKKYAKLSAIFLCLIPLYGCTTHNEKYYSYDKKPIVMQSVPAPKEVVAIPAGYVSCKVVAADYYDGTWIGTHRVCHYHKLPGKKVWVEGYWYCPKYTNYGQCSSWVWRSGHWSRLEVIY